MGSKAFPRAGPGRQDDQVRALQSPERRIQVAVARWHPNDGGPAFVEAVQGGQAVREHLLHRGEITGPSLSLPERKDELLRLFQGGISLFVG